MISKDIKLVKGMQITHDRHTSRHFKILKVARKYATVIANPTLPGIDDPEKVLIGFIYDNCHLDRFVKQPKAPNKRKK